MKMFRLFGNLLRRDRQKGERGKLSPPLSELTAPLTDAELRELAAFLAWHDVHRGFLNDIHALDGFLTCIRIGPQPMAAEEWIAWIFVHDDIDADEIDDRWPLIGRLYHMISASLSGQPPAYRPLFETHPGLGQGDRPPLKAWCEGFMTATVLRDPQWERMSLQPGTAMWLYPIWECASADESGNRSARRSVAKGGKHRAFGTGQLKQSVLKMNGYWNR